MRSPAIQTAAVLVPNFLMAALNHPLCRSLASGFFWLLEVGSLVRSESHTHYSALHIDPNPTFQVVRSLHILRAVLCHSTRSASCDGGAIFFFFFAPIS